MAITYIEKGIGLHNAIRAAGHHLEQKDGIWESDNDDEVQAIIASYDMLPDEKSVKIASIKTEGLRRINLLFPAIISTEEIEFYVEFWLSIKATSRSPTVNFQKIIDIFGAAKTAVQSVNAATTKAGVAAVTAIWPT